MVSMTVLGMHEVLSKAELGSSERVGGAKTSLLVLVMIKSSKCSQTSYTEQSL